MTFNTITADINPHFKDILNRNRSFIEQILTNTSSRHKQLLISTLSDPKGVKTNIPRITNIILNFNNIISMSNMENRNDIINSTSLSKFINMFLIKQKQTFKDCLYYIPKYNLYHYGNICHLNSSLLMLSSIPIIMIKINKINNNDLSINVMYLRDVMNSSYSPIDIKPLSLINLIQICNININELLFADHTIKQLYSIIQPYISINDVMFWDCSYSFISKEDDKLTLPQLVDKYEPKYLIVNGQDFIIVTGMNNTNSFSPKYATDEHEYKLISMIIHMGAHYIILFAKDDGEYVIRDDMFGRYENPGYNINKFGQLQVTVCCYAKIF